MGHTGREPPTRNQCPWTSFTWQVNPMMTWRLAAWKTGVLYDYEDRVLKHIPPYFEDLKWCLHQLFDLVFCPHSVAGSDDEVVMSRVFHKNDATHDLMIEVLKSTLAQL